VTCSSCPHPSSFSASSHLELGRRWEVKNGSDGEEKDKGDLARIYPIPLFQSFLSISIARLELGEKIKGSRIGKDSENVGQSSEE